jgi:hypothetical protein
MAVSLSVDERSIIKITNYKLEAYIDGSCNPSNGVLTYAEAIIKETDASIKTLASKPFNARNPRFKYIGPKSKFKNQSALGLYRDGWFKVLTKSVWLLQNPKHWELIP